MKTVEAISIAGVRKTAGLVLIGGALKIGEMV
jgi:hypothetical protein